MNTITASTNLTESEIEQAVKEAEAHAEEDRKNKEGIEVRNNADSLVYNTEKTLKDLGDKVSAEEKAKVEAEIANVKKALEGTDTEAIKSATEKLTQEFYAISERLYANAGAGANANADPNATGAQGGTANGEAQEGTVYDADYKVDE